MVVPPAGVALAARALDAGRVVAVPTEEAAFGLFRTFPATEVLIAAFSPGDLWLLLRWRRTADDRAHAALIDRELYLPEHSWCANRGRCREAAVPDDVVFATKPQLAQHMVERAMDVRALFGWVAADEVYGQNPGQRACLEGHAVSYVMAVPCSPEIPTTDDDGRAGQ